MVTPAGRKWLILAGLAKARSSEVPWLVADLGGDHDRAARRRWSAPPLLGALACMVVILVAVAIVRTPDALTANTPVALAGPLAGLAIGTFWSPESAFLRRRRLILRRHGLDEDGSPMTDPTRIARMSPRAWAVLQGTTCVGVSAALALLAIVWLRPWDVTVTTCEMIGNQLTASGDILHRGRSENAPDIEWVDPETGSVIVSTRLVATTGDQYFVMAERAVTAADPALRAVTCRVDR